MKSIGVRELRQHASRYLRDVQAGETVQVTDRGRPIALIVPVPETDALSALEASGRLQRGVGDFLDLGEALPPTPGLPLPSELLAQLRADER